MSSTMRGGELGQQYEPTWRRRRDRDWALRGRGINEQRVAEPRRVLMYCVGARCGQLMPDGDVGMFCPDCRAAVVA